MGTVMEFVNPLVVILSGLTLPVKIAWGVWLAWGAGQLGWFAWTRRAPRAPRPIAAPVVSRESGVRPVAIRPTPAPRKVASSAPAPAAPYGTSDFIAALDEEQRYRDIAVVGDHDSPYR